MSRLSLLLLLAGCFDPGGRDKSDTGPIDTDADTDSDTDADSDSDTDADTDSDTDADTDADTDSDTDSDTDADTDNPTDADADGYANDVDCDDGNAAIHPGAAEVCDDRVDEDCDGTPNGCERTGTVSLSGADAKIVGEAAGDWLGYHALSAGDLDGDGASDLVLGSLFQDAVGESSGRAYVFYGAPSGTVSAAAADVRVDGAAGGDVLGCAVFAGADLDGDGVDDLAVGASARGSDDAGSVYAFTGGLSSGMSASAADATWEATTASAQFGYTLEGGDVDGDGADDLLVATLSDGLYVVAGPVSPGAQSVAGAHAHYTGSGVGGVMAVGDVDGDGQDDIATSGPTEGVVYVVSSDPGGTVAFATAADATYTGEASGDGVGQSVGIGGDANGDGYGDLFVGAYAEDAGGAGAGAVYVVFGPTTGANSLASADVKLTGAAAGDYCGATAAWAADVNGDAADDLVVGCHHDDGAGTDAGAAWVFHGPLASGSVSTADLVLQGEAAGDYATTSVLGAGDANGDGFADLLVDTYARDDGGTDAGAVYLVLGGGL